DALYLVPQTLYKLHPDFDKLLRGVLSADLTGCVCLLVAGTAGGGITERLAGRLRRSLTKEDLIRRVIFVRRWVG
ncbi:unnamed protein product, partial [Discosporangium mesarthrocarpum]